MNTVLHERYRILRQLGSGGMGTVYEAVDTRTFGKAVALKEILVEPDETENPQPQASAVRAFEREAKILTTLDHDAFPQVIEYFSENGRQFLVMQLIGGDDLAVLLAKYRRPFPLKEVLGWTYQLLDALDYLHTLKPKPIYHRDIKPQNLKLTPRGIIKLLDFGIAKDAEGDSSITALNQTFVAATMHFSPLEQILRVQDAMFQLINGLHGDKVEEILLQSTDARSDIYALGATLYYLLTTKLPTDARERALEVWSGKPDPLPNPMECNKEIKPEISAILLKAMAIDREWRFASAVEMKRAIDKAVNQMNQQEEKRYDTESNAQDSLEVETVLSIGKSPNLPIEDYFPKQTSERVNQTQALRIPISIKHSSATQSNPKNAPQTSVGTSEKSPAPKRRSLWILPVAAAVLLLLGGAFFGISRLTSETNGSSNSEASNTAAVQTNINPNQPDSNASAASKAPPALKTESAATQISKTSQPTAQTAKTPKPAKSPRNKKASNSKANNDDKIDVGRIIDDIIGKPDE